MNFSASLMSFYKNCSEKFGLSIWVPVLIDTNIPLVQQCKFQQPGYYDFSAVIFSNYTYTGKPFVGISPIGVNVQ